MPIDDVLDDLEWEDKTELPEETDSEETELEEEAWEWEEEDPSELDFFHLDEVTVRLLSYTLPGKARAAKKALHALGFPCAVSDLSIGHPFALEIARYGLFVLEADATKALDILNQSNLLDHSDKRK
jgi:FMN phosphatase YigB (HAD superfamily)